MVFRLSPSNIEQLKRMPESGMGYQIVKIVKITYISETIIVLNGTLAIDMNGLKFKHVLNDIIGKNLEKAILSSTERNVTILGIVSEAKAIGSFVSEDDSVSKKRAIDGKSENANGDELFVRLSAFENDFRIDKVNHCLLPGSFTTTASDALRCKIENANPKERYALPNNLEIQWAFNIQPKSKDTLQRGVVQSDFGKEGGGREVYFENGTSNRTFIMQSKWQNENSSATQ